MQKIEINVETGEKLVIDLTPLEVQQAQERYAEWLIEQENQKQIEKERLEIQLADIQSKLDALK